MKSGIILTAGDPRAQVQLAVEAEAAGWDGVFTWDGVALGPTETYDPWVLLGAIGLATERVTIGAIVTPPSRRRPWKLAREAVTVDRLSNGRLVLPVGLGALDDGAFANVGEPTQARIRAERLDESLAILDGLWSGEPFAFAGRHFSFGPMVFQPTPVQRPRIPIWVVATAGAERSIARARRWDGLVTQVATPAELEALATTARAGLEPPDRPFEIVAQGTTPPDPAAAAEIVAPWRAAGATWWVDADWEKATVDSVRARIRAGPPGLSEGSSAG
jgi:alkanesulfonate monooxygenase SsuD/methylene tetrahydromethanopterin reductase-like flavin-dependent oxidoreductase (luciferase family)